MYVRFFVGRCQAAFLFGALVLLPAVTALAQIDPTLYFLQKITTSEGLKSPVLGPPDSAGRRGVDQTGAHALLRFRTVLNPDQITLLEKNGVQFEHDPTHKTESIRRNGTIYRAYLPWTSLNFLASYSPLLRAEASWSPDFWQPLEQTSAQVGAAAANILPELGVDGRGMLIGDIDSGIDVLHPAFFHADGGLYNWIDVNKNGVFDPGIDAVDLNNNGTADHNEILRVLDGAFVTDFSDPKVQNFDAILQTRSDWLYADQNMDHQRNSGRAEGFDEQTPAYGEPLFVVDDVNQNGLLDVGEKLVRLKTSKIRKLVDGNDTYSRGQNLIDATRATSSQQSAHHGTGVSGILVGGQPGFHDRVGLAPAAELIVYTTGHESWETTLPAAYIEDAISQKVNVLLHEWSECMIRPLDGSSNLELAMDQARQAGILQVTPAGNLNAAQKHTRQTVEAGQIALLNFDIPDPYYMNDPNRPYAVAYGSIHWREGSERPNFLVRPPNGLLQHVVFNNEITPIAGGYMQWTYETTSRGTHFATFFFWSPRQDSPLPTGRWSIEITDIVEDSTFIGRISDYYSGWAPGISWANSTTNEMTLCFPSTADSAIGVAAHAGRHDQPYDNSRIGELRNFSGRGPRIDGRLQIALSAPDDPYAPLPGSPQMVEAGWGKSWYAAFGGTSGAGPHVAAAFALLQQLYPDWTPTELENRMVETTDRDNLLPAPLNIPSNNWGWGKLNIYRALYDRPIPNNQAPTAALKITDGGNILRLDASESTDPDGDSLEYRFDINYDGQWEIDWSSTANPTISLDLLVDSSSYVRLEVRDPHGARSGALAKFAPPEPENPGPFPDAGPQPDTDGPALPNPDPTTKDTCSCNTTSSGPVSPTFLLLLPGIFLAKRRHKKLSQA